MNPPKKPEGKAEEKAKTPAKPAESAAFRTPPRGRIYEDITQTVGGTPLVRLKRIGRKYELQADIAAKLEAFNPVASVKDRVVLAMIEEAEKAGKIIPGKTVLIESTSGNTGVSLACIAAAKGYRLILTMPENAPFERQKILKHYGAEMFLTPSDTGMKGAVEKAKQLLESSRESAFSFGLFENPAAVQIHAQTTAKEIWEDTDGKVDIIVAGVGTGATITGLSYVLRKLKPDLKIYAVEPEESAVLSGNPPTQHGIDGIGAGFTPPILDPRAMDGVLKVSTGKALETAREVTRLEGISCGISSGAALAASIEAAQKPENKGKLIVTIFPSFAERDIATPLFENPGK